MQSDSDKSNAAEATAMAIAKAGLCMGALHVPAVLQAMQRPDSLVFIATRGTATLFDLLADPPQHLVGFAIASVVETVVDDDTASQDACNDQRALHIEWLCGAGAGAGTAVLDAVHEYACENGVVLIFVEAIGTAVTFYQQYGFSVETCKECGVKQRLFLPTLCLSVKRRTSARIDAAPIITGLVAATP